jgi:CBS domain-containing protein
MKTLARDIMSTEIISVRSGTSIEEALKLLVNSKITGLPVTDEEGRMVGVFSDYDVIAQISSGGEPTPERFKQPISFSKEIKAITEQTPLSEILELLVSSKYRRLPVVGREGKLVGMITRRDLMKLFYYRMTLAK